jgi:hypothetical protein
MSIDSLIDGVNKIENALGGKNQPLTQGQVDSFKSDGFLLPATFSPDGNGLPYTKVPSNKPGQLKRNIITWFVPEFGTVRMFINPQNIQYIDKKTIHKDRTKGGFALQYWGEELTEISISGTTGSSGVEGINMLHEIYRAEQLSFDAVGLTLAANNSAADAANNLINAGTNKLFETGTNLGAGLGTGLQALGGILGMDSPNNNLAPQNLNSLAQLAFTVEMYYSGAVYRGYFTDMTMTEKADNFLWDYTMRFVATQKRGYRTNGFPFQRSAADGPSSYTTPMSYNGNFK